ncbi:DUF3613 domain-containing protein [Pseudomonas sp. KU43P]|uniref:DUF3613 domain-containing protein n=1 Tax=Pseudomonas sp. KU43P TaxID=2487887 RepID=UPI0012A8B258|nr:DUF3613 domain-containing protein [Pseudomonas sp. KU43P]BBH48026.1 hypothetical protein KU43P_45030 [Pseudomonas sp. KU43P]
MIRFAIVLACCASVFSAWADDAPHQHSTELTATEALLQVQSSGEQASNKLQVQTARERDLSKQRWLETYKYAIPDFYRWERVKSSNN